MYITDEELQKAKDNIVVVVRANNVQRQHADVLAKDSISQYSKWLSTAMKRKPGDTE